MSAKSCYQDSAHKSQNSLFYNCGKHGKHHSLNSSDLKKKHFVASVSSLSTLQRSPFKKKKVLYSPGDHQVVILSTRIFENTHVFGETKQKGLMEIHNHSMHRASERNGLRPSSRRRNNWPSSTLSKHFWHLSEPVKRRPLPASFCVWYGSVWESLPWALRWGRVPIWVINTNPRSRAEELGQVLPEGWNCWARSWLTEPGGTSHFKHLYILIQLGFLDTK